LEAAGRVDSSLSGPRVNAKISVYGTVVV
jgi:hypothetical protein